MHDLTSFSDDALMYEWREIAKRLKSIKSIENAMRDEIVRRMFPHIQEGTQRRALGNGYNLKAVYKPNYKLDKDRTNLDAALAAMVAMNNEGSFIAQRLIKFKPELSLSEYKSLLKNASDGNATARACLTAAQKVITIEPGSTTLEIEEPTT